ncbi:hypothetical protein [Parvibaculum sp.]|jgi:hypothetical protein|uniref:hypothetical protein n=1 Tax=Parvibaculum sp. TaxID=2024848 RepID=UPI000C6355D5|nr:hypothetical protein [Parvibaculum sp.]MAM94593.1 hypothetical protein [Parvibaculum sp.]|tara:strand:+ start:13911 stop:15044 length:1134 start_codon:yes stop_codon:yes gene_type:complete
MKVLLLDTGFSAAPIYDSLVESGHQVWVMGNRLGDIIARKAGDRWINRNYSKIPEVCEDIERLGIEYIVPGCTDVSLETCVQLGMKNLDDFSTNNILSNKKKFRSMCANLDIPAPCEISLDELPREGRYICKPVDSFSGKGISVFDGSDYEAAQNSMKLAREASQSSDALIETFVEGRLHSYSAFIEGHVPRDSFFVYEGSSINPFAVDTSYVEYGLPESCQKTLANSIEKIARALNLRDGLVHTQFLWDGERPWIVEMSRRCPGDLYALLIEYSTGYQYAAKYASYFLGESCAATSSTSRYILRHTVTADHRTIYGGLQMYSSTPIKAFYPLRALGDELEGGHAGRAGVIFCELSNRQQLVEATDKFLKREAYTVS